MKLSREVLDRLVAKGLLDPWDVAPRAPKWHNRPTTRVWKGKEVYFKSQKEARRFDHLAWLESAGRISDLRLQVPYRLEVDGQLITTYYADFVYRDGSGEHVEDAKGHRHREYKIKKKLVRALYGIVIEEV